MQMSGRRRFLAEGKADARSCGWNNLRVFKEQIKGLCGWSLREVGRGHIIEGSVSLNREFILVQWRTLKGMW